MRSQPKIPFESTRCANCSEPRALYALMSIIHIAQWIREKSPSSGRAFPNNLIVFPNDSLVLLTYVIRTRVARLIRPKALVFGSAPSLRGFIPEIRIGSISPDFCEGRIMGCSDWEVARVALASSIVIASKPDNRSYSVDGRIFVAI